VTSNVLNTVETLLPADTRLEGLTITEDHIVGNVVANTTPGFAQLVANLQAANIFNQVEIGDVNRSPTTGIQFMFNGAVAVPKKGM
jgi:hypothetical protein